MQSNGVVDGMADWEEVEGPLAKRPDSCSNSTVPLLRQDRSALCSQSQRERGSIQFFCSTYLEQTQRAAGLLRLSVLLNLACRHFYLPQPFIKSKSCPFLTLHKLFLLDLIFSIQTFLHVIQFLFLESLLVFWSLQGLHGLFF